MSSKNSKALLATIGAVIALSGCGGGADRVASPGIGAFPPPPPVAPPPPPPVTPPPAAGPAADCPIGFNNVGTVANNTLRNCQLPQKVIGTLVLPNRASTVYSVSGRVDIGDDQGGDANAPVAGRQKGILTLEPGVRVFGAAGLDYLVINRGSQIFAEGTASAPIVLTSKANIEGTTNIDSIGQWGGLVILGRAPINNCPGTTTPGTANCEAQVEGTNAFFGGNQPADNSGVLKYFRVQYSGFQILPNNELNGITLAGVGNGTTMDYVQVHNSSDDGIEWFGGTVNAKHLVLTGNDDDNLDTDNGWNGRVQYAIVRQRAGGGDRGAETSNAGGIVRAPVSNPKVANATFVGRVGGGVGIILNSGTNSEFYNTVVTGFDRGCLDVDDAGTTGKFHSVFFSCPKAFDDDADGVAAALFNAGTRNTANGTSTLTNIFVNGANETAVQAFGQLKALSSFFDETTYIGAVKDANDTWWNGWTCGLTADKSC